MNTDIICRTDAEDQATRAKLLQNFRERHGRPRAKHIELDYYTLEVDAGAPIIQITVSSWNYLDIAQAKALHAHLAEAIAAAEANIGGTHDLEDDGHDYYVSCFNMRMDELGLV